MWRVRSGEKRSNATHVSTTDPEARLYRKGKGKPAQLCYMGHILMENRNGLAVATRLTQANGMAEREAALGMIDDVALGAGASFGTDKAYNAWRFTQALKDRHLVPHVALRSEFGWGGVKIVPPPGYEASQRCRKRIEDIFGWVKTVGGLAKRSSVGYRASRQASISRSRPTIWSACPSALPAAFSHDEGGGRMQVDRPLADHWS